MISTTIDFSRVRNLWGDLLALTVGGIATLAFAPFGFFPLAVLTLAVLFFLWRHSSPRRALWRGWLFGVGFMGTGASWIHISIDKFGGVGLPLAVAITVLFVVVLAIFPALAGWAANRFFPHGGWRKLVLVYPTSWLLLEWLRGWFLGGFPWLQMGYSQIESPLSGLAPLLGVLGISWVVALSAGLLAYGACTPRRWLYAVTAIALLWGASWLGGRFDWTQPAGEPMQVSLVQGNVAQEIKWLSGQRQPTLELYLSLTQAHWDSDLIIWPETAIPAFYHQVKNGFLKRLGQEARTQETDLLIGIAVWDARSSAYYNSMVTVGAHQDIYHKRHLVPFGEYLPLKRLLAGILNFLQIPMSDFSPGEAEQAPLQAAGYKIGISICYEDAFGAEVITALPAAHLLVNASNDAWFGDSLAPHQHLEIARMRALETGRYLLRATNTGISAIIGPAGDIVARAPQFKTHVLTATVVPMTGTTPYVRTGNLAVVSAAMLLLGLLGVYRAIGRPIGAPIG